MYILAHFFLNKFLVRFQCFFSVAFQTFISELVPLLFGSSYDPTFPPILFNILHSILKDFLPPYYHSSSFIVVTALISAANIFCLPVVTQKPYKLFADSLLILRTHGDASMLALQRYIFLKNTLPSVLV